MKTEHNDINIEQLQEEVASLRDENANLQSENTKLEKITDALIYRMEESNKENKAYRAFEHAVNLSEKVNQQTALLNKALQELENRNHELAQAHGETIKIEQRLNDAIESIQQPMVILDNNENLTFFNSKFSTLWGDAQLKADIGDNFYEIIQIAKRIGLIRRAEPNFGDNLVVYQFSDNRWFQVSERETQGKGTVVLFSDITEVKQRESNKHERVIRKKNKILQSLIDNLKVGILRVKKTGELEFWNETFLRYAKLSSSQIISSKTLPQLVMNNTLNGLKFESNESEVQIISDSLILERDVTVINETLLYTFTDITSQYRYAQTLSENERWIRMITDNIPALIAYIGADRKFMYTNKAYRDWYGLKESDFEDIALEKSHLKGILPRLNQYFRKVRQGETVSFSSEEKNAQGKLGILQKVYLPHVNADGIIVGHFVLATDITDQVKSENTLLFAKQELESRVIKRTEQLNKTNEALREAVENKTKFIAALSHDLLQPLSAAILFNESLKSKFNKQEDEIVRALDNSLSDLNGLIRTLIDISKLDAGLMQPDIRDISLEQMLNQLAQEFSSLSRTYNVEFKFKFHKVAAKTDTALLSRILRNLLTNALKYGANGKVLFVARKKGEQVHIMILDQGVGMTEHEQSIIFKEFERLPNNFQYNQSLGLGLPIVEKMAKLLSHKITLTSEKNRGSCFGILAPLTTIPDEDESQTRFNNHLQYSLALESKSIWQIDNDPNIRIAMTTLFDAWSIELESYASFEQCEKVNGSFKECDLLLLDYHLDDNINGIDIAIKLRQQCPDLPIIMCTANHSKELEKEANKLDVPILYKPVNPLRLRMMLNSYLM